MYSVSILLCLCLFLFHTSIEETTTMTSVGDRDQVINSQIKDQGNKIAKLTALVVKLESEMAKITHSQEATTTTASTTAASASTTTEASTTAATTSEASTTAATTSEATTAPSMTAATMGSLNAGVGDQALLLHIKDQDDKIKDQDIKIKDQDIKIAKLEALLEHQISEVKIQVEHQNTKFSEENAKFSEENAKFSEVNAKFSAENVKFAKVENKFYILESEIKRLTHSKSATTSSPQTTTSSPQTTTSSTIVTSSGVVFTRWGRRDCPAGISTPVYNGTLGGSWYAHTGAAVNRLCMPNDPTWNVNKFFKSTADGYVYGGGYPVNSPDSSLNGHVSPCAVCRAALFSTKVVIPGRNTCYPGWTKAYDGELTSGYHVYKAASEYTCLDRQPQKVVRSGTAGLWYSPVLAKCGALPCPPYQDEALLTCVVCLK